MSSARENSNKRAMLWSLGVKHLDVISSNVEFGPKRGKFGPKKAQKGRGPDFFQTVNLNFLKEDHYTSFYTKNQQKSMKRLEDISSNVDFGLKGSNLDQQDPV